jgi:hypothetical protein
MIRPGASASRAGSALTMSFRLRKDERGALAGILRDGEEGSGSSVEGRLTMGWAFTDAGSGAERPAIACCENGIRTRVLLSNLSFDGCRLKARSGFEVGERLTLLIMELGAELPGTVKWVAGGQVGVRFG